MLSKLSKRTVSLLAYTTQLKELLAVDLAATRVMTLFQRRKERENEQPLISLQLIVLRANTPV